MSSVPTDIDLSVVHDKAKELATKGELKLAALAQETGYSRHCLGQIDESLKRAMGFDRQTRLESQRQKRIDDVWKALADVAANEDFPSFKRISRASSHNCRRGYLRRIIISAQLDCQNRSCSVAKTITDVP